MTADDMIRVPFGTGSNRVRLFELDPDDTTALFLMNADHRTLSALFTAPECRAIAVALLARAEELEALERAREGGHGS